MNNIITLQKDKHGNIYCREISKKGAEYVENNKHNEGYWENGGRILLNEIEKILNKEV